MSNSKPLKWSNRPVCDFCENQGFKVCTNCGREVCEKCLKNKMYCPECKSSKTEKRAHELERLIKIANKLDILGLHNYADEISNIVSTL
jgi:reverse gyrase